MPKSESIQSFFYKYRHALIFLYVPVFFIWFALLEKYAIPRIWMDTRLDDFIPFNELFVIPYFLWYFYVPVAFLYFFFTSRSEFLQMCTFLFIGMTICLIIYTIWPNGQNQRPSTFVRDNFLVNIVKGLYGKDTPTNVCPSIHSFNAIGIHIAINRSKLKKLRIPSFIMMVLVCMSTVFLKQHAILDVFAAIALAIPLYIIVYRRPTKNKLRAAN